MAETICNRVPQAIGQVGGCGTAVPPPPSVLVALAGCGRRISAAAISSPAAGVSDGCRVGSLTRVRRVLPEATRKAGKIGGPFGMAGNSQRGESRCRNSTLAVGETGRMSISSDVIVVGSGASAVHAAQAVGETGLTVTMLDVGHEDTVYPP